MVQLDPQPRSRSEQPRHDCASRRRRTAYGVDWMRAVHHYGRVVGKYLALKKYADAEGVVVRRPRRAIQVWIVQVALKRPYTFIVFAFLIAIFGSLSAVRTPTDIFPSINI